MTTIKSMYRHVEPNKELVDRQLEFFAELDASYKPKNIKRLTDCEYDYDYVIGGSAQTQAHVDCIYTKAREHLWGMTSNWISNAAKWLYGSYVIDRALAQKLDIEKVVEVARYIVQKPLREVKLCHGDLTLENVIVEPSPGKWTPIVFIDPGDPRGMVCRENDEGKLLQSLLTKWDIMNGSSGAFWLTVPFPIQPIHLAFLATHYIRLLNHPEKHHPALLLKARATLDHVFEMFKTAVEEEQIDP